MAKKAAKLQGPTSLQVPTKEFMPILNFAKNFVAERDFVPALKHLYFDGARLRAFSGEVGVMAYLPWEFTSRFALPAATIVKIVSSLYEQGVESVGFSFGETFCTLTGGSFQGRIALAPGEVDEFTFREPPVTEQTALPESFWSDLERAQVTVAKDASKHYLRGVHWTAAGALMSSDSQRITVVYPVKGSACHPPMPLLIPDHLLQRLGSRKREVQHLLIEKPGTLWAVMADASVYGSMIAEEFPESLVDGAMGGIGVRLKEKKGTWAEFRKDVPLRLVLDRLIFFADPILPAISVSISGDEMHLTVRSERGGPVSAEETVPLAKTFGPGGQFLIHGGFFQAALDLAGYRLHFVGPMDALYFMSDDRRLAHLVMPVSPETEPTSVEANEGATT